MSSNKPRYKIPVQRCARYKKYYFNQFIDISKIEKTAFEQDCFKVLRC